MIAPVVGSGRWPAWMASVSRRRSFGSFTCRLRERLLEPCPEELDEIDLGEDAGDLLAFLHDGDVVVVEDLAQAQDRRVRADDALDGLDERLDHLGEPVLPLDEEVQEV